MWSKIVVVLGVLIASASTFPGNLDLSSGDAWRAPENDKPVVRPNVEINHGELGTDVRARVETQLWQSKDGQTELTGYGNYGRHYGGPGGNSQPSYGYGFGLNHNF